MRIGLQYPAQADPSGVGEFAARAEALGYDSVWVVEDCFLSGGIALAAVALGASRRLTVGIGLIPVVLRNPAVTAMEIATLASIFPGRLQVAFGHGVEAWMRQVGARPANRVVALEETVVAVRELLAGQTVSCAGRHVQLDAVALDHPPSSVPPLLVGTTGPATLAAAARCADGVLLAEGCGPSFIESIVTVRPADRDRAWETVVYAWLGLDDDRAAARRRVLPVIEAWRDRGLFPNVVATAVGAGPDRSADPDPDPELAFADEVAIWGSAEDCAQAVRRWEASGATDVVLAPQGGDVPAQVTRFAAEVLPRLRA